MDKKEIEMNVTIDRLKTLAENNSDCHRVPGEFGRSPVANVRKDDQVLIN
jgi:hypothetical protein